MSVLGGKRILVVDDEPLVRYVFTSELEDAGAAIVEAVDGLEALTHLRQGIEFDALVTDVRMPNMDGWTLAERARELYPELPILYITGYSDVAARPVSGSQLLSKPVNARVITTEIQAMTTGGSEATSEVLRKIRSC